MSALLPLLSIAHLCFVGWMIVACVRRRQTEWLLVILFTGGLGAFLYFVMEHQQLVDLGGGSDVRFRKHSVSAAELADAEADVRRLDTASAWSELATALRSRNRHERATEAARRALELDGSDVHARYELGRSLLARGLHAEAAEALERVRRRDEGHDYGEALLALAKAREGMGDLSGARTAYEALAERSSRPEVLYHLAVVQGRTGDRDAAIATLQRLVSEAEYAPAFARRETAGWARKARRGLKSLGVEA